MSPNNFFSVLILFAFFTDSFSQTITFIQEPQDTNATVGNTASFTCSPLADGSPGLASWSVSFLDGRGSISVFSNATNVSGATAYLSGDAGRTQLFIVNVGKGLNGARIECRGTNMARMATPVLANIATLTIHYIPEVTVATPNLTSNVTESVTFSFTIDSNPAVDNVMLLQNDTLLSGGRYATNTTSATISSIACDDSGTYTLQVSNTVGNDTVTITLTVMQGKPFWKAVPTRSGALSPTDVGLTSYVNGCPDIITITCTVPGRNTLTALVNVRDNTPVLWKRSSFTDDNDPASGSSIVSCIAANGLGSSGRAVTFTVQYFALSTSCGESPLCLGLTIGLTLGITAVVVVIIVIIVIIILCIKKRSSSL